MSDFAVVFASVCLVGCVVIYVAGNAYIAEKHSETAKALRSSADHMMLAGEAMRDLIRRVNALTQLAPAQEPMRPEDPNEWSFLWGPMQPGNIVPFGKKPASPSDPDGRPAA